MKIANIVTNIFLLFATLFFSGCELDMNEDINTDLASNENFKVAMATIIGYDISGQAIIEQDDLGTVYVVNADMLKTSNAYQVGERIFYTYHIASKQDGRTFIYITDVSKVQIKDVEHAILADSESAKYGNDPINIVAYYTSKAHLNLQYKIRTSSHSTVMHQTNLLVLPDATPDRQGYLEVTLLHNANGDGTDKTVVECISFTLSSLPGYEEGILKGLKIKNKNLDNKEVTTTVSIEDEVQNKRAYFTDSPWHKN